MSEVLVLGGKGFIGRRELLRKDNMPDPNRLPELLGRAPAEVIED